MSPPTTRPRVLIVDGHSVIFKWGELRSMHAQRTATARDRLISMLTRHQDASGIHVVVVFDGRGPKASASPDPHHIQVFYSKDGQTADSIIERLAAKYAERYDLTIATDDYLERTTVESFGASWISADQLARDLDESEADLRETLSRLKRPRR